MKRFSEKLCKFYQDSSGLKVAIIRPSGAYGRFDNFDENTSHVLPAIIKRALSGVNPMKVWGSEAPSLMMLDPTPPSPRLYVYIHPSHASHPQWLWVSHKL